LILKLGEREREKGIVYNPNQAVNQFDYLHNNNNKQHKKKKSTSEKKNRGDNNRVKVTKP
jgi:hypothetical protein